MQDFDWLVLPNTLSLDSPAKIYKWNNPIFFFAVITPESAKDIPNGEAFTQAMLKVLRDKEESIPLMTVQTVAGHIESEMERTRHSSFLGINRVLRHGVEVHSIGINVPKRPL